MSVSAVAVLGLVLACAAMPSAWLAFDAPANSSQRRLRVVALALLALFTAGFLSVALGIAEYVDLRLGPVSREALGILYPLCILGKWCGHPVTLGLLALALAAWLWQGGRTRRALALLAAVGGEFATCAIIKISVGRARPPGNLDRATDAAFPSGHASNSVLLFGVLLVLLAGSRRFARFRGLLSAAYVVAFTLIGASRIVLRAHAGLDVLSGYAWGAYWLALLVMSWNGAWCRAETSGPPEGEETDAIA
ncbi:MAG: phosphatase PAP2 family protein [Candidatus Wallbacteria bacterium]|nr:phosphatase PAP2 family protein [Candidatus Wallbacteria bacterium]